MASNANIVVLMGNLTRNPELRYTPQGRAVTTLSLAVNRRYRDRDTGELVESTDFIPVSVWGKQAENCDKYLSKGRGVYVEGRLNQRRWEDSNGESRSKLEVVAANIQFLPSGGAPRNTDESDSGADDDSRRNNNTEFDGSDDNIDDEEIPF